MEQRRPRLGDIIDDYCPRERRLSNHVIVALIGDEVKQTRCTTCDADHPYKGAKVPARRKKQDAPAALYQQVLDGVQPEQAPQANGDGNGPPPGAVLKPAAPRRHHKGAHADQEPPVAEPAAETPSGEPEPVAPPADDEGPVHRPLIRATLPRHEGQTPERKAPDFTLRLPGARLGPFRNGEFQGQHPNRAPREGPRPPGKHQRPGGHKPHRQAQGGPPRGGQGGGRQGAPGPRPFNPRGGRPHHGGGGKKRSR